MVIRLVALPSPHRTHDRTPAPTPARPRSPHRRPGGSPQPRLACHELGTPEHAKVHGAASPARDCGCDPTIERGHRAVWIPHRKAIDRRRWKHREWPRGLCDHNLLPAVGPIPAEASRRQRGRSRRRKCRRECRCWRHPRVRRARARQPTCGPRERLRAYARQRCGLQRGQCHPPLRRHRQRAPAQEKDSRLDDGMASGEHARQSGLHSSRSEAQIPRPDPLVEVVGREQETRPRMGMHSVARPFLRNCGPLCRTAKGRG